MSHDADLDETVTVTEGDVTVRKSFAPEEFPVPAIKFAIESAADDPRNVHLTDHIPEWFPMKSVGFHPDFESDNWTAYKDHRVEYERTLDAGESLVTVYGVRLDDDADVADFLVEPTLTLREEGEERSEAVDDILDDDSNQVVRDVLSGEEELPGAEAEAAADADEEERDVREEVGLDDEIDLHEELGDSTGADELAEAAVAEATEAADAEATEEADAEATDDVEVADADEDPGDAEEADAEAGPSPAAFDDGTTPAMQHAEGEILGVSEESDYVDIGEELDDSDAETDEGGAGAATATPGNVAAALAAELRDGTADDADVETLRDAIDEGLPRSVDVRLRRLQSQVEDLAAYTDALEEFIDENGTAQELLEGVRTDVDDLSDDLATVEERLHAAEGEHEALHAGQDELDGELEGLRSDVEALEGRLSERVDATEGRVDGVEERLDDTVGRVGGAEERVDAVEDRLDGVAADVDDQAAAVESLDEEMAEVREDVAAVDTELADTRDAVESDLSEVREDVAAVENEVESVQESIEDLRTFRERLSSALGAMGGSAGAATDDGGDGDGDDAE